MTPLITMLEQADCGSRELDAAIWLAIGLTPEQERHCREWCRMDGRTDLTRERYIAAWAPNYSTSLDAALSALPEGWEYSITTVYGFVAVELPLNCGDHVPSVRVIRGDCNTALALITAILKATREAGEWTV